MLAPKSEQLRRSAVTVNHRRLVVFAFAVGWLAAAQVGKVPPALSLLVQDFGLSMVEAGWVASAIACVAAVLGIFGGLAASAFGYGRSLVLGLGLIGVGSLMATVAPNLAWLLVSRFLEALGFVVVVVTVPSFLAIMLADKPAWRQRALVIWGTIMPVGVAAMMVVTPLLMSISGWRGLWFLNALVSGALILFAVSWRQPLASVVVPCALNIRVLGESLRLPGAWLMGLCFGCYTAIWFMLVTWVPSFAVSEMGYSLSAATRLMAAAVVFNIAGNLSAQLFSLARVPRWSVLAGVQLLMGGFGWVVFSSGFSDLERAASAILACGLSGALPATVFSAIPFHARRQEQIAVINGIIMQCGSLGTFAGPPAIAFAVTHLGGWDAGRWLIPLLAMVGLGAAVTLRGAEQRMAWRNQSPPMT
jgi:CP family cyanate transporter-like MFS transporter